MQEWADKRAAVLVALGNHCTICGKLDTAKDRLWVHRLGTESSTYKQRYAEITSDDPNLVCKYQLLCKVCRSKLPEYAAPNHIRDKAPVIEEYIDPDTLRRLQTWARQMDNAMNALKSTQIYQST